MSGKYSFTITEDQGKPDARRKIIIGRQETETIGQVVAKILGYMLFFRDRLQIQTNLHMDSIPFVPDLVQLDYELRPVFWVECSDCGVNKLNKLAVKIPAAEIWIVRESQAAAEELSHQMKKADLRRNRYGILGLNHEMFLEVCALVKPRNEILWVSSTFEPPAMQFDFNGLWFDVDFTVLRF